MTAIDRTAYPRLAIQLSKKEVEAFYAPSPEEIAFVSEQGRGPSARLSQLVLLKTFQHLGYFPSLRDIPENIIKYLRKVLELEADVQITLDAPRSLYRHHAAIREFLAVRAYSKEAEAIAEATIQKAVQTLHNPADLINAALEELIRQRFELPAFSHLDRMGKRIRTATHEAWYKDVFARLSQSEMQTLDRLPSLQDERSHSDFVRIKEPPGRPRLSEMRRLKDRLTWLSSLLNTEAILLGIPKARIIHFAKEARSLESHQILEMQAPRRYTLLICLVHQAKIQCRDHLVEIFINRMQRVHDRAKVDLDLLREKERQIREALIELLAQVTLKTHTTRDNGELGADLRRLFDEHGGAEYLYQQCQALTVSHGDNTLPFLWPHYANHRKVVFQLLNLLELRSTSEDKSLLAALQFLRENPDAERLRPEVSLSFASLRWQKHILERDEKGERWFKRRAFELCVLSYLSQDLKSGDVCVLGSEQYADYREQLLTWEDCEPLIAEYCAALGIPATADGFVNLLRQELMTMAERVDARFPEDGQLSFNKRGDLILKRLGKQTIPIGVTKLKRAIQERMPERNLLDILAFFERWTHYTRHFGPASGSDNKLTNALGRYIMTIFTYGANLGAAQAAKHSRGVFTQRMIVHINRQHIDTKNLEAVSRDSTITSHYLR